MTSSNVRDFYLLVERVPELRSRLELVRLPLELINLAREQGIELTGEDVREIAQTAYQNWVATLDPHVRSFFDRAQQSVALNDELKQCQSPAAAIDLATRYGFELSERDLHQAATAATAILGFSFEKLWFKNLGLL
jgi:Nif11 domain